MNTDLDILQRDTYIEILKKIIDGIVKSGKSSVFAIDGKWGIGKSFIIDKLNEEIDKSKYVVFNYNCWQYDYYEEPLVAIISNIQDNIQYCGKYYEEEFLKEQRAKRGMDAVYSIGNSVFKKFTGVDLQKIGKNALDINKEYSKENSFKKVIEDLQGMLKNITKSMPIIFIIDELDRCMPEYAIKVLERIHHIFHGFENVVVLLSVDRTQLDYSIKKIFGENTDIDGYLKKFVDFTIKIDSGIISDNWEEKYRDDFFESFDLKRIDEVKVEIRKYLSLFKIREIEKILGKIIVINNILKNDEKYILDDEICCYEVVSLLVKEYLTYSDSLGWIKDFIQKGSSFYIDNQIRSFDKNKEGNFGSIIRKFSLLLIEKSNMSIVKKGGGEFYLKNKYLCIWYGLLYWTHVGLVPYDVRYNYGNDVLPYEEFAKYKETVNYINELMKYI